MDELLPNWLSVGLNLLLIIVLFSCSPNEESEILYPINYRFNWGFINEHGEEVVKLKYVFNPRVSESLSDAEIFDSLFNIINRQNTMYVNPNFWAEDRFSKFKDHYPDCLIYHSNANRAEVVLPGIKHKHGFINDEGELVIPFKFEDAMIFYENLAAVKFNGKYGFIDTTGKFIINPKFDYVRFPGFLNGLAHVSIDKSGVPIDGYINKKGEFVWQQDVEKLEEYFND